MLDECGQDVNVEHGAWFGSGAASGWVTAGNPARVVRSRRGDVSMAPAELLDPAGDGGGS